MGHSRVLSDFGGSDMHPTRKFARYLAAYRGHLTRSEAARRSGLPEVLWERVEGIDPSGPEPDLLPAAIVAAMCAGVGADVGTGLALAGQDPDSHSHLIERPAVFTPLTSSAHPIAGPYIATPHVVSEALTGSPTETHLRLASVYRQLARSNSQIANEISQNPPDARADFWSGYVAAMRAVAEQQAWAADQEENRARAEHLGA
jgi:hypothetical protein